MKYNEISNILVNANQFLSYINKNIDLNDYEKFLKANCTDTYNKWLEYKNFYSLEEKSQEEKDFFISKFNSEILYNFLFGLTDKYIYEYEEMIIDYIFNNLDNIKTINNYLKNLKSIINFNYINHEHILTLLYKINDSLELNQVDDIVELLNLIREYNSLKSYERKLFSTALQYKNLTLFQWLIDNNFIIKKNYLDEYYKSLTVGLEDYNIDNEYFLQHFIKQAFKFDLIDLWDKDNILYKLILNINLGYSPGIESVVKKYFSHITIETFYEKLREASVLALNSEVYKHCDSEVNNQLNSYHIITLLQNSKENIDLKVNDYIYFIEEIINNTNNKDLILDNIIGLITDKLIDDNIDKNTKLSLLKFFQTFCEKYNLIEHDYYFSGPIARNIENIINFNNFTNIDEEILYCLINTRGQSILYDILKIAEDNEKLMNKRTINSIISIVDNSKHKDKIKEYFSNSFKYTLWPSHYFKNETFFKLTCGIYNSLKLKVNILEYYNNLYDELYSYFIYTKPNEKALCQLIEVMDEKFLYDPELYFKTKETMPKAFNLLQKQIKNIEAKEKMYEEINRYLSNEYNFNKENSFHLNSYSDLNVIVHLVKNIGYSNTKNIIELIEKHIQNADIKANIYQNLLEMNNTKTVKQTDKKKEQNMEFELF